jgi:hypothetical protein
MKPFLYAAVLGAIGAAAPMTAPAAQAASPPSAGLPAQTGLGPRLGSYYLLRFNETGEPGPAAPGAARGRLKYIPLDRAGHVTLSLSGMERLQLNSFTHETLATQAFDHQLFAQLRHIYGADLHLGSNLRLYGELSSGQAGGRDIGPQPARQRNDLALQQAFAEVGGRVGGGRLSLRAGRQEIWLGNGLIVSTQPFANIPLSFDGATLQYRSDRVRIDALAVENVANAPGLFGDSSNAGRRVWGVYGSLALPRLGRPGEGVALNLDPFYVGFRSTGLTLAGRTGLDERHGLGARLWGSVGPVQLDWTAVRQTGGFAGRDVEAWAVFTDTAYVFADAALKPRVGVRFDVMSGGESGGKVRVFTPLYTGQQYYTASGYLAGANLVDAGPTLALTLAPNVRLTAYNRWFWKEDASDAVYGRGFAPLPGTAGGGAYIGMQPQAAAAWSIDRNLFLTVEAAYFDVSRSLERQGGRDVFYSLLDLTFVF